MTLKDYENKVFIADSRDMRELPNESVGLVVTSPPYFNIKDYSKDGKQEKAHSKSHLGQLGDIANFNNFVGELTKVWQECFRVLKPNGKLIINAPLVPMLKADLNTHQNRHIFDLNSEIQNQILAEIAGLYLVDTYVWNRTNPSKSLMFGSYPYPSNFYAQNTIEFVTVYVKEGKALQPPKDIKEQSRLSKDEWVEFTKQVWNIPIPGKGDLAFGTHSALMPEQLAERCIRLYSFANEIVLDPFAGSGTTLRVAKRLNRKFVGYELVKSYSDIIELKVGPGICREVVRPSAKKTAARSIVRPIPEQLLDKVHRIEHLKLIDKLPDDSVDLICVDPPYNLGKGSWDTFTSDEQFLTFTEKWIRASEQKLRPGGSFYIFNTPRNSAHILMMLESLEYEIKNWITWNKKDGFSSTKKKFLPEQETILFAAKPGPNQVFNADAIRIPYESTQRIAAARSKGILKNGKRWFPNEDGRLCSDVWNIPSERHGTKVKGKLQRPPHPTMKPLALMDRIILASSRPGDVVLDFFAGSGSTLVSAKMLGRRFIGGDTSPEYVALAKSRLKEVKGVDKPETI